MVEAAGQLAPSRLALAAPMQLEGWVNWTTCLPAAPCAAVVRPCWRLTPTHGTALLAPHRPGRANSSRQ
jgi:hypothetical protein